MADSSGALDPSAWINLGATGMFILALMTGRFYTKPSVDELRSERDKAMAAGLARERQLTGERDRALAERDEMVEVIKEFTHTAGALLPVLRESQMLQRDLRRSPTRRERAGDDQK